MAKETTSDLPENVSIIELDGMDNEKIQHVVIDRGNGEFTSMLKSTWDEQQAQIANMMAGLPNNPDA
jgi:hypothetical protein